MLAFAVALALWPGVFLLDDAYITLNNARVVLTGFDPVYRVSPLIGATSSVHLALVALLGLFFALPLASAILSAAAFVLYAAGLKALAVSVNCRGWALATIVFTGLFVGYLPLYYFNGLETTLAMAAVAWSLALRDCRFLPILCGVMPFIRPELVFLSAPLFVRHVAQSRHFTASTSLAMVAAFVFSLWYLAETGMPFPNTGGAKVAFFAENQQPLIWRLTTVFVAVIGAAILPLAFGLVRIRQVPAGWCVGAFLAAWLMVSAWIMPGSLLHNHFRYLAPLVPALCYPLAALLSDIGSNKLKFVLIGWTIFSLFLSLPQIQPGIGFTEEGFYAAEYVRDQIPAQSTVLVHDAGIVAWLQPEARIVDVVGLKTPSSSLSHKRFTRGACKWGRALDEIARNNMATHLVAIEGDQFWECVSSGLEREGWTLKPIRLPNDHGYVIYEIRQSGNNGPSASNLDRGD